MNVQLTIPDGFVLDLSNPVMSGTTYNFTTEVNSFSDSDIGNYTCTATIRAQPSSTYLTGTGELSDTIQVTIGEKLNLK